MKRNELTTAGELKEGEAFHLSLDKNKTVYTVTNNEQRSREIEAKERGYKFPLPIYKSSQVVYLRNEND